MEQTEHLEIDPHVLVYGHLKYDWVGPADQGRNTIFPPINGVQLDFNIEEKKIETWP